MIVLHTDATNKASLVMAQNHGPACVYRGQVLHTIWSEELKEPFGYDPRRVNRRATIEVVPHIDAGVVGVNPRHHRTDFEYSWIGFENYDDDLEGGHSIPLVDADTYLLGLYGKWKLRYCCMGEPSITYESMQHYLGERTLTYLVRHGYCPHHGFPYQNVEKWDRSFSDYVKIQCSPTCHSRYEPENPDHWWMNPHYKGDLQKGRFVLRKFMEWSADNGVSFKVGDADPKMGHDVEIYVKPEYATLFKIAFC